MPKRKKALRKQELLTFPNVLESPSSDQFTWLNFFRTAQPLIVEFGCGKGEYACSLAEMFPEKNFVGMDRKPVRLWVASKTATECNLQNVCFLRGNIEYSELYFPPHSIDELWITFPDPYLKNKDWRKRLMSPNFQSIYKKILKSKGMIHIKSDSLEFMQFARTMIHAEHATILQDIPDIDVALSLPFLQVQTYFENKQRALGKVISYLCYTFSE